MSAFQDKRANPDIVSAGETALMSIQNGIKLVQTTYGRYARALSVNALSQHHNTGILSVVTTDDLFFTRDD